jgi:hypothetical protein
MSGRRIRAAVLTGVLVGGGFGGSLGADVDRDRIWRDVEESSIRFFGERRIVPRSYRTLAIDSTALASALALAPPEGISGSGSFEATLTLPLPGGELARFRLEESPIMAAGLAAKFPQIRTYRAFGIDDPTAYARLDLTPHGFHGIILSSSETVYIDPYARGAADYYISYFRRDHRRSRPTGWRCDFADVNGEPGAELTPGDSSTSPPAAARTNGTQLRTYRLAVAATGEYTQFHGGTKPAGMAAIVTAINRVNGIYERDVAIRMVLVANNDEIVYTNPATDPYQLRNPLGENQVNVTNVIGSANYDIGHLFSGGGGGGVASLGVPCKNASKAQGYTSLSNPIGDPFWIDYVAHEMGHQWGATHTFNGNSGSCSGNNRTGFTAYEPGSGSTIMAYAGICGAQDLQPNSDDHFHVASYDQILDYSQLGTGNSCAAVTATGNTPPTAVVPDTSAVTIPVGTPFELCGSASDPNHLGLTYGWEEWDLGPAGAPTSPVLDAPIFRSFSPTSDPCRTFPKRSDLLGNTTTIGELLPSYGRALTFRMTVRDNMLNGGGADYGQVAFTVDGGTGPFLVNVPNTPVSWTGLVAETVGWDVAGTNGYCTDVDVLLSLDGGVTFPTTLVAGTANDGAVFVTPPNVTTTAARIKVKCSDSVFFDLSNTDFGIVENGTPTVTITSPAENSLFAAGDPISFTGDASDPEDGDRTAFLDWSSNIDGGPFGSGGSPSTTLTAGYHTITATASDSVGQAGSDTVHLAVEEPGCPAFDSLTSDPPVGPTTYLAVDTVTVGPAVTIGPGADVVARAGNRVRFDSGVTIAGTMVAENTPTPCP